MKFWSRLLRYIVLFIVLAFIFCLTINWWMVDQTSSRVHSSLADLPDREVALVLGTSPWLSKGVPNTYFHFRIEAASELYNAGKVKHFILSGDNKTIYYNEPVRMQEALMEKGVPDSAITLDYAGFRTLDSVVRCKKVFGQDSVIIVTQAFHSYRALFIADFHKMHACAYAARIQPLEKSYKVLVREFLARPKAMLDLYLLSMSPKFLGEKEDVPIK